MKVLWTEAAVQRLAALKDYVAEDSPRAASRLVERLVRLGEGLARFPGRGRQVPELPGTGLRELVSGRYRLVYRTTATAVEVITVFEGHRRFPKDDLP